MPSQGRRRKVIIVTVMMIVGVIGAWRTKHVVPVQPKVMEHGVVKVAHIVMVRTV